MTLEADNEEPRNKLRGMDPAFQSNNPAAERTGYGCFGKVFVSGYISFLLPEGRGMYPSHTMKVEDIR
jgi:hypothetical protein